ncbi:hypothetical protein [Aurantimonas sp. VKM B-3413]|uniref:hypothetical protein n=1 Tax=Aurantimonas sp. VKM B-3413 TaxID=2779401 RepID=UPI001E28A7F0|nr:hypothetical protein [Aurantimonas sp. VKM B-3413]MCB8839925.1 hypothetical protein [Aurantimonas sp. VKM B-3413]
MRRPILPLASVLLVLATGSAVAEWTYLIPGDGDRNIHRAFAFADNSGDRLEFACTTERRDFFYSAAEAVSDSELDGLKAGKPTILVRLDEVGVVPLDADDAYQDGGRLIFVTSVKPAFINDLAKAQQPIAAGMQAAGEIVKQSLFPTDGLESAMKDLAKGCGF